jgi:uncharacterized protein (TIGR00369 family)
MSLENVKSDDGCFVCGPENPIGLKVDFIVDKDNKRACANVRIGANFQGWQGVVHGGIIASLLDEAAIYACRGISDEAVTAGLSVRYKIPVAIDCLITLEAEVVSVKRHVALVKSALIVESSIMAEAEVKVMLLNNG